MKRSASALIPALLAVTLLGDVFMDRGSLGEAVNAYPTMVDQSPGPQAYARIAQRRWLNGDVDGALNMMFKAAESISSSNPEAAAWVDVQLAMMLVQIDEIPVAEAILDRALSVQPNYSPALHVRGHLLLVQRNELFDERLISIPDNVMQYTATPLNGQNFTHH